MTVQLRLVDMEKPPASGQELPSSAMHSIISSIGTARTNFLVVIASTTTLPLASCGAGAHFLLFYQFCCCCVELTFNV